MAKAQKSLKQVSPGRDSYKRGVPAGNFRDRNLVAVNPAREQFEPTPAEPVRQHYKMAGGC